MQQTEKIKTEIQYLQNAANSIGLIIHQKFSEDRRKTVGQYFATQNGTTVSPVLDYEKLNYFLFGWIEAGKNSKPQKISFRVRKADGKFLNAGTDLPSWFTLEKARELVNYNEGQTIVESDGQNILWEIF